MGTDRKEIFSEKVSAGRRTYFVDVKETVEGDRYLVISESQEKNGKFERSRVMIFEEHVWDVLRALGRSSKLFKKSENSKQVQ